MDDEDRVFEKLRRSPLEVVTQEIFHKNLLFFDYQTQKISVRVCKQLEDICKKHNWNIEDIIEATNEK